MTLQVYGSSHSGAYKLTKSIDKSSNKDICNGKAITSDTSNRELFDLVKIDSSDQPNDMNSSELDGYQGKCIVDIYNFKIYQTLFGSLTGVN